MKRVKLQMMLLMITMLFSAKMSAQNLADTIKEKTSVLNDRLNGIDERLMTTEGDVSKLSKIKMSGYIQAQYTKSELATDNPKGYMWLRRARLKAAYDAGESVRFVLQSDFLPSGFALKDAYAQLNEPWMKTFSLWAGIFNRPNYEVEYSSSQREVPERSRIIRALYPNEREIGMKLEANPTSVPLKFQLALLNGNIGLTYRDLAGANINPSNKDFDEFKDIMARLTYSLKLGNFGGLDFGAHGYMGQVRATSDKVVKSDFTLDSDIKLGDPLKRSWVGAEFQLFADVLGGLSLKGEYLFGNNAMPGYKGNAKTSETKSSSAFVSDTLVTTVNITNTTTNTTMPNQIKNFSGFYLYLVKNVGKKHQFAARYDVYDPNTKISGSDIGLKGFDAKIAEDKTTKTETKIDNTNKTITNTISSTKTVFKYSSGSSDIKYSTLTLAWHYYFDDNIRITLAYEMPMNEKVGKNDKNVGYVTTAYTRPDNTTGLLDYSDSVNQNMLTLRLQAKF